MLVSFLLFCFAVIGMTNIVVDSNIFEPVRAFFEKYSPKIHELMTCHQCCGFWCGIITGLFTTQDYFLLLLYGCAGSYLATINYIITEFIISKTEFLLNNDEVM